MWMILATRAVLRLSGQHASVFVIASQLLQNYDLEWKKMESELKEERQGMG